MKTTPKSSTKVKSTKAGTAPANGNAASPIDMMAHLKDRSQRLSQIYDATRAELELTRSELELARAKPNAPTTTPTFTTTTLRAEVRRRIGLPAERPTGLDLCRTAPEILSRVLGVMGHESTGADLVALGALLADLAGLGLEHPDAHAHTETFRVGASVAALLTEAGNQLLDVEHRTALELLGVRPE